MRRQIGQERLKAQARGQHRRGERQWRAAHTSSEAWRLASIGAVGWETVQPGRVTVHCP
jgi:hypothetical protein